MTGASHRRNQLRGRRLCFANSLCRFSCPNSKEGEKILKEVRLNIQIHAMLVANNLYDVVCWTQKYQRKIILPAVYLLVRLVILTRSSDGHVIHYLTCVSGTKWNPKRWMFRFSRGYTIGRSWRRGFGLTRWINWSLGRRVWGTNRWIRRQSREWQTIVHW